MLNAVISPKEITGLENLAPSGSANLPAHVLWRHAQRRALVQLERLNRTLANCSLNKVGSKPTLQS